MEKICTTAVRHWSKSTKPPLNFIKFNAESLGRQITWCFILSQRWKVMTFNTYPHTHNLISTVSIHRWSTIDLVIECLLKPWYRQLSISEVQGQSVINTSTQMKSMYSPITLIWFLLGAFPLPLSSRNVFDSEGSLLFPLAGSFFVLYAICSTAICFKCLFIVKSL